MVMDALPAAYAALKLGAGSDDGFDSGMFDGRDVTHWSSHLMIAGSIVGLITFIGGIALNQLVIAIQGGILFATNGIGAYYINKFSVFHAAGEVIQALAKRIHTFWEQIGGLQEQVTRFEGENARLEKILVGVNKLAEEKSKYHRLKREAIKELDEVRKKLEQMAHVCQPLVQAVDQFVLATGSFNESGHNLESNIEQLVKQIKALVAVRNGLKTEIAEIDVERQILNDENTELQKAIETLEGMSKNWPKKYKELRSENKKLHDEIKALRVCVDRLNDSNAVMKEIKEHFDTEIIPALEDGVPNTEVLKKLLSQIKAKIPD